MILTNNNPIPLRGVYDGKTWKGLWAMNMSRYENGVTFPFEYQVSSSSSSPSSSSSSPSSSSRLSGYFIESNNNEKVIEKNINLSFESNRIVHGSGKNKYGSFTLSGTYDGNQMCLVRQYDNQPVTIPSLVRKRSLSTLNDVAKIMLPLVERLIYADKNQFFIQPITYPIYIESVIEPIDLMTIKKKLLDGLYEFEEQVYHDIELTFSNVMLSIPRKTVICHNATTLLESFEIDYDKLRRRRSRSLPPPPRRRSCPSPCKKTNKRTKDELSNELLLISKQIENIKQIEELLNKPKSISLRMKV